MPARRGPRSVERQSTAARGDVASDVCCARMPRKGAAGRQRSPRTIARFDGADGVCFETGRSDEPIISRKTIQWRTAMARRPSRV